MTYFSQLSLTALVPDFRRAYTCQMEGWIYQNRINGIKPQTFGSESQNMFTICAQAVKDTQKTDLSCLSVACFSENKVWQS